MDDGGRRWKLIGDPGRCAAFGGVSVEDHYDAGCVSEDFAPIQASIAARTRKRVHPRRLASDYLLSGLLLCGACGARYIGHAANSGKNHYYGCQTKLKSGAAACTGKLLNRSRAEGAVVAQL